MIFLYMLVTAFLTLLLLHRYFKRCYNVLSELGIKGPPPTFLFGNAKDFQNRFPLDVFSEWTKEYGKVFGFYEGLRPSIVISDPEMIKEILVKQFPKFHIRPITHPFMYHPENKSIIVTEGNQWRRQRIVIEGAFKPTILMQMVPYLNRTATKLLNVLETQRQLSPEGFDVNKHLRMYVLDSLVIAAFGYDSDCLNNQDNVLYRYAQASSRSASPENPLTGLARLFPSLTPFLKLFDREHRNSFEDYIREVTRHVKDEMELMKQGQTKPSNLLQHMILAISSRKDGETNNVVRERMSETAIISQTSALIGGAYGTTQSLLLFLTHALAEHRDVQDKVWKEIDENCLSDDLSYSMLSRLKYLDLVIKETLRLYTVAPGVARTCAEDCQVRGVRFRKGITVRLMSSTISLDEEYFQQPHKFIPERFETPPSYAWMPFGHGPRRCVGQRLGLLQVKTGIVKILQKFVIEATEKTEFPINVALKPILTPKNGVHVKLILRKYAKDQN